MQPTLIPNNITDCCVVDAVKGSQLSDSVPPSYEQGAHLQHLLSRKTGKTYGFTSNLTGGGHPQPSLLRRIAHVVGMRAKKHMSWVAANPIVAGMADKQTALYGAIYQFVDSSVCRAAFALQVYIAIATWFTSSKPGPADIRPARLIYEPHYIGYVPFRFSACVMGVDETKGLPRHLIALSSSYSSNRSGQPTPTLAVSIRDAIIEIKCRLLYIIHATVSLLDGGRAGVITVTPGLTHA